MCWLNKEAGNDVGSAFAFIVNSRLNTKLILRHYNIGIGFGENFQGLFEMISGCTMIMPLSYVCDQTIFGGCCIAGV